MNKIELWWIYLCWRNWRILREQLSIKYLYPEEEVRANLLLTVVNQHVVHNMFYILDKPKISVLGDFSYVFLIFPVSCKISHFPTKFEKSCWKCMRNKQEYFPRIFLQKMSLFFCFISESNPTQIEFEVKNTFFFLKIRIL